MNLSKEMPSEFETPISQDNFNTKASINCISASILFLIIFLILQSIFIAKLVHIPRPEEIKHIEGKLLRSMTILRNKKSHFELLVRTNEGDVSIYAPTTESLAESIKSIDRTSILSIDYYQHPDNGPSTQYVWRMMANKIPVVDYYYSAASSNRLREFDLRFIALTAVVLIYLCALQVALICRQSRRRKSK